MKKIVLISAFLLVTPIIFCSGSGEHPKDFTLTYYMKDTVSGSNLFMEIKKGMLEVDYINGVRNISKRKYYELDDEEMDKLYTYMVDEQFMDRESPEKNIKQNVAAQYMAGGYKGRENVLIFSAAGDPPMYLLKLKHKFWDLVSKYDKHWKRDMQDVIKIEGFEDK